MLEHIEWIKQNLGDNLLVALQKDRCSLGLKDALDVFLAADPSEGKRAVDWLVKTYLGQGFLWEDIEAGSTSKVFETLQWFANHRNNLAGNYRNLEYYSNIAQVHSAISVWTQTESSEALSSRKIKQELRQKVLDESIVLYRSNRVIWTVPLTIEAAKWWGRGTRWCTAAENHNYFDQYNREAPLIIGVFPEGLNNENTARKFQFWSCVDSTQVGLAYFMDENDQTVSMDTIQNNWDLFKPLVMWAFQANPAVVDFLPVSEMSQSMAYQAIKRIPAKIKQIPKHWLTQDILLEIVEDNTLKFAEFLCDLECSSVVWNRILELSGDSIYFMPKHMITREICLRVVSEDFYRVNLINREFITEEFVIEAIQNSISDNLKYISSKIMQENWLTDRILIELCVKSRESFILMHSKYPESFHQYIYSQIVVKSPNLLSLVPKDNITPEMIDWCLNRNPDLIVHCPAEMLTLKHYQDLIKNPLAKRLRDIPAYLRTPEIEREFLARHAFNIKYITPELLDPDMLLQALVANPFGFTYAPKHLLDQTFCSKVFNANKQAIYWIPLEFITAEMCFKTIKENPQCVDAIPHGMKTVEMCLCIAESCDDSLKFIPPDLRNLENMMIAVKTSKTNLNYLGETDRNRVKEALGIKDDVLPNQVNENVQPLFSTNQALGEKWKISDLSGLIVALQKGLYVNAGPDSSLNNSLLTG